jgi:hypothetical protein
MPCITITAALFDRAIIWPTISSIAFLSQPALLLIMAKLLWLLLKAKNTRFTAANFTQKKILMNGKSARTTVSKAFNFLSSSPITLWTKLEKTNTPLLLINYSLC